MFKFLSSLKVRGKTWRIWNEGRKGASSPWVGVAGSVAWPPAVGMGPAGPLLSAQACSVPLVANPQYVDTFEVKAYIYWNAHIVSISSEGFFCHLSFGKHINLCNENNRYRKNRRPRKSPPPQTPSHGQPFLCFLVLFPRHCLVLPRLRLHQSGVTGFRGSCWLASCSALVVGPGISVCAPHSLPSA